MAKPKKIWSKTEARRRLGYIVDLAITQAPQYISERGKVKLVVLSVADYKKLELPNAG